MAKCDDCAAKAAKTAAGPMPGGPPMHDGPPADGGGDLAGQVAALEARVAALEDQAMASAVASLDAMPVNISQYV